MQPDVPARYTQRSRAAAFVRGIALRTAAFIRYKTLACPGSIIGAAGGFSGHGGGNV